MNRSFMKISSLVLAAVLMLTIMVPAGSMADDSIVELKREDVADYVLAYSPMLKGLELSRVQLSSDYKTFKDRMDGLQMIYDQLDNYYVLDKSYKELNDNYKDWLQLSAQIVQSTTDPALIHLLGEMTDGDYLAIEDESDPNFGITLDGPDENLLTGTEEQTLKAEIDSGMMMTVEAYIGYTVLRTQFSTIGIFDPNLSRQEEYDTFIYPIEIAPAAMQSGVFQLGIGLEQAAAGLESGAESLYDATLMLEGYLSMQKMSHDMSLTALNAAAKKYELGQMTELAYKEAVNDELIAELQYQSLVRDVDNLKMNLNVMLGQPVLSPLALVSEIGNLVTLESEAFYVQRGLEQRSEILSNDYTSAHMVGEIDIYEEYLGKSSIEYIRGLNKQSDLVQEKAYAVLDIESDIRKAYMAVKDQEENLMVSKLQMEDSLKQQSDMQINVRLGYVTEAMAKGLDVLVTQSTNDYYKAYRDYLSAVTTLELQSGIGQAGASATGGGITLE